MILGYHAPLPPARTGVAEYAADLLTELRQRMDVQVGTHDADLHLYHLGNNHLHREIHQRALLEPGIVLLHDAVLHHFYLGSLSREEYLAEFAYNYGHWNRELAQHLWDDRARSGVDPVYFGYPMLRRIAEGARAVVVHNPAAAALVRAHAPNVRVAQIPHLFRMPSLPDAADVAELRAQLRIPEGTLLVAVMGHLRESKRIASVVHAVAAVRERGYPVMLLLAGEFASDDLRSTLAPLMDLPFIRRAGYLSEWDFWRHAAATDVVANLRFPAAGETSGIAVRLMGLGRPVILSSGVENADYPEGTHLPLDCGAGEIEMLEQYLELLLTVPELGVRIGQAAADHIAKFHNLKRIGSLFEVLAVSLTSR